MLGLVGVVGQTDRDQIDDHSRLARWSARMGSVRRCCSADDSREERGGERDALEHDPGDSLAGPVGPVGHRLELPLGAYNRRVVSRARLRVVGGMVLRGHQLARSGVPKARHSASVVTIAPAARTSPNTSKAIASHPAGRGAHRADRHVGVGAARTGGSLRPDRVRVGASIEGGLRGVCSQPLRRAAPHSGIDRMQFHGSVIARLDREAPTG